MSSSAPLVRAFLRPAEVEGDTESVGLLTLGVVRCLLHLLLEPVQHRLAGGVFHAAVAQSERVDATGTQKGTTRSPRVNVSWARTLSAIATSGPPAAASGASSSRLKRMCLTLRSVEPCIRACLASSSSERGGSGPPLSSGVQTGICYSLHNSVSARSSNPAGR